MPRVLPSLRGEGMCCEESAAAIVARSTSGEGPNLMLRTEAFAVRVTGETEGRAGMPGAVAEGTGRNPGDGRRSVSRHPLAGGPPVPEQAQLMERVVERSNMPIRSVRAYFNARYAAQAWTSLNMRNRRGT